MSSSSRRGRDGQSSSLVFPARGVTAATPRPHEASPLHVHQQCAWEGRTVPKGGEAAPSTRQGTLTASQSSAMTLNCGRPLGSKDSTP
ncbi:hypothetical protein EV2_042203 [Malus domestica]